MELIDKNAAVTEIEKLKNKAIRWAKCKGNSDYETGKRDAYSIVLDFFNTFEVKEVDLEKEVDTCFEKYTRNVFGIPVEGRITKFEVDRIARHFYSLGINARK